MCPVGSGVVLVLLFQDAYVNVCLSQIRRLLSLFAADYMRENAENVPSGGADGRRRI